MYMKKVGFSFRKLSTFLWGGVILLLIFVLPRMVTSSKEEFGSKCVRLGKCTENETTCTAYPGLKCEIDNSDMSYTLTCSPGHGGRGGEKDRIWTGMPTRPSVCAYP